VAGGTVVHPGIRAALPEEADVTSRVRGCRQGDVAGLYGTNSQIGLIWDD